MSLPIQPPDPDFAEHQSQRRVSDVHARTRTAIAHWRNRLLDLTKRNRALNFKPSRVATVTIVDEVPVEVFRHLCLEDRPMRFRPTLPSATKKDVEQNDGLDDMPSSVTTAESPVLETPAHPDGEFDRAESADEDDAPQPMELDFAPYDPETLDDRHTDDVLQACATPEALDKSLRRLDEQARATIEEQGVNVLFLALGMLHYTESADSKEVLRAPLVMVPVTLGRKSARTGYTVEAGDDDPMVNPALVEYLHRSYGLTLQQLRLSDDVKAEAAGLQSFYQSVSELVAERARAGQAGWAVKTDIFLGLFSFKKLVMVNDLEENGEAFAGHRMVQQLISRDASLQSSVMGLPEEVRTLELDRDFAPEKTAQVVDADSSQLRAIVAVSKGHSLVIEGPPGTGKSQTITNLIAQTLNEGKSVLFVAEKMAALQVVQRRLVDAGLGEFCLELHASKANRRAVMQELRAAIDASLQRPVPPNRTHRLPRVRGELTEYAKAVHAKGGSLNLSPYVACGLLDKVLDAPRLPVKVRIHELTQELLADTERLLEDITVAVGSIGVPSQHPWRDTARTFYTSGVLEGVCKELDRVSGLADRVIDLAADVERTILFRPLRTTSDLQAAVAIASVFRRSPGAPLSVLESQAWNSPPAEAKEFVETGRKIQRWRNQIDQRFNETVLDQDHASDIAHVEKKTSGLLGLLAFLDGRFRAIRRRWRSYRKPGYSRQLNEQANDLKLVDQYRVTREALEAKGGTARSLFGDLWQGERSDCDSLDQYIAWVVEIRGLCIRHGLESQALSVATQASPDTTRIEELERAAGDLIAALSSLRSAVQWPPDYLAEATFEQLRERVREMSSGRASASDWAAFEQVRTKAMRTPAAECVNLSMQATGKAGDVPFAILPRAFRRAVLEQFLEQVMEERAELREFRTITHEQRLKEFRELDEMVLEDNQAAVVSRLRGTTQERLQSQAARAGLPFLQREMAKQRRLAPLRRTLKESEATVRAIKPCFLMSPLTVAQYLNGKKPSFDLVIFDEASQLPPEDAIGAISRGSQLVVVGDPKQLPPTNFFASMDGALSQIGDDGLPIVEDSESILEEYMGAGVPVTRLKWHYRSAHESLISFSNVSFYDSDLYVFPSVETHSETRGLSFEFVEDGVYEGKGLNMAEARRVVDAVVRHAKERPHESLGVGTFNLRQQLAILDEIELRRRQDPSIEPFFSRSASEPFFVKNLENIQGDERDVIFLSVTYAKAADGRLRCNFGPINGENGWRRLNVLTTRARQRMRVFSSMRGDEINPAATSSRGALLLRDFLRYAELGRLESIVASATAAAESPFEHEVAAELTRRGIRVQPQVGVAGYRIDIGVLDDEVTGRYVCGIECDGVAYHSAETARDRDRLRQQVLEARGWMIVRVWSTDWFKDRPGQISRLLNLIEQAKRETKDRIVSEAEAEARARELAEADRRAAAEAQANVDTEALAAVQAAVAAGGYKRPEVPAYRLAVLQSNLPGLDLLEAPVSHLAANVAEVVEVEGPVHVDDAASRVVAAWGVGRMGSRIATKMEQAVTAATRGGLVVMRGNFLWSPAMSRNETNVPVRSRAGTKISGERVAPEETQEAIRLVLRAAGGMTQNELLSEVRQVLGVGKTGLAPGFTSALKDLVRAGSVGEGSAGLALRG